MDDEPYIHAMDDESYVQTSHAHAIQLPKKHDREFLVDNNVKEASNQVEIALNVVHGSQCHMLNENENRRCWTGPISTHTNITDNAPCMDPFVGNNISHLCIGLDEKTEKEGHGSEEAKPITKTTISSKSGRNDKETHLKLKVTSPAGRGPNEATMERREQYRCVITKMTDPVGSVEAGKKGEQNPASNIRKCKCQGRRR